MTDRVWETTTDPAIVLAHVQPLLTERSSRLVAAGFIHAVEYLLRTTRARTFFQKLDEYAAAILKRMKADATYTDVDTNAANRGDELQVRVRRQQAADLRVSPKAIADTLAVVIGGDTVGKWKEPGRALRLGRLH